METTQVKAVRAYNALCAIQERREYTTRQTSKKLFDLKKELTKAYEFQLEREAQLIDHFGLSVRMNGTIDFGNKGDDVRAAYIQERRDLDAMPFETDLEPFEIPEDEPINPNMDEIEALADFVTFL